MFLSNIKIFNFRKFPTKKSHNGDILPGIDLSLNKHINLLVGENDSGKSAIIDAIKFVVGTQSNDWVKLFPEDFHVPQNGIRCDWLKIECAFNGFTSGEAAAFLEWLTIDDHGTYTLQLTLHGRITQKANLTASILYDIRAGDDGAVLPAETRERLRSTYLRPLRDAEAELAPKKGSRLSQILAAYEIFKTEGKHRLQEIMDGANDEISRYFQHQEGKQVLETINDEYLKAFSLGSNLLTSQFKFADSDLRRVLEKLELKIKGAEDTSSTYLGLGSNNLLFIATELLLLKKEEYAGLKLVMIEEIEAHIHPQSQLNLIEFLKNVAETLHFQLIITTHSNSLASKVNIENLFICKGGQAFSLRSEETMLSSSDYGFLHRFLDDTKANLFFANGLLIVEGPSENLIIPALAAYMDRPLEKHGVSIVNVNSTALLRYSRIFQRRDGQKIGIKVACITDRDIPTAEAKQLGLVPAKRKTRTDFTEEEIQAKIQDKNTKFSGGDVRLYLSSVWTLEYDLAMSCFKVLMHQAISIAIATNDLEKELTEEEGEQIFNEAESHIDNWETIEKYSSETIAALIYKPLALKMASKAVAAQLFARLLLDHKEQNPFSLNILETDPYLQYLVQAINYTTGKQNAATTH